MRHYKPPIHCDICGCDDEQDLIEWEGKPLCPFHFAEEVHSYALSFPFLLEAANIRQEEIALAGRRRKKENKAEWLKAYLSDLLGGQSFETAKVSLSFRSSSGVRVTNNATLIDFLACNHDDCILHFAPKPDKTKLKALLKQGVQVPGAELEARKNLQIK